MKGVKDVMNLVEYHPSWDTGQVKPTVTLAKLVKPSEVLPENKRMAIETRCPHIIKRYVHEDELDMVGFSEEEFEHFGYIISLAGLLHYLPNNKTFLKYVAKERGVNEEQAEKEEFNQILDINIITNLYGYDEEGVERLLSFLHTNKLGENDTAIYKKQFYLPISEDCSYFEFAIGFNHDIEPVKIELAPGGIDVPSRYYEVCWLCYKDKNHFKTSSEDGWFQLG